MDYKKLDNVSKDITSENVKLIEQLFPNVITEQDGKKVVDFEKLQLELGNDIADDSKEKYQLTWPGKRQAIIESRTQTDKTLVPLIEKSVDFENTKNVYIEGDNLEVLKILQESYTNKIKCIYIDPPYNTGKDFIYKDNFTSSKNDELEVSGQVDEEGNRFVSNPDSNGRYHSDWLSMMYPRLKLARNLLKENGVIFISIDDNEYDNLKKICDEIFSEDNYVCTFCWQKNFAPKNDNKYISTSHEYIMLYSKNKSKFSRNLLPRTEKNNVNYKNPDNDIRGVWSSGTVLATTFSEAGVFEIVAPNGTTHLPPNGRCWRYSKEKILELLSDNRMWFGKDGEGVPRVKRFLSEMPNGIVPQTLLKYEDVGSAQDGTQILKKLFNGTVVFDFPKPVNLISRFINISCNDDDYVLDFFAGSSTTSHSVMLINALENKRIKSISVQLAVQIDGQYETLTKLGQERIKRAAEKIKNETYAEIDYGFRVYKLQESILKNNNILSHELSIDELLQSDSKYIYGTNKEDILTHIILDMGLKLDVKIKELDNNNYNIEDGLLYVSLCDSFTECELNSIVECCPEKLVLDENSFNNDAHLINTIEEIKNKFPSIDINVI